MYSVKDVKTFQGNHFLCKDSSFPLRVEERFSIFFVLCIQSKVGGSCLHQLARMQDLSLFTRVLIVRMWSLNIDFSLPFAVTYFRVLLFEAGIAHYESCFEKLAF